MVKRANSIDNLRSSISPFDAIKRALLRRGFVPEAKVKPAGTGKPDGQPQAEGWEDKGKNELEHVAEVAQEILYETDTVFPFTLFPDTITLEREKVNISKRFFFKVAKIIHIPVRDLLNVEADVGPFFGSLHISSRYYSTKPFTINFLWKSDTLKLQRLLQGYIIAYEREIDASKIKKDKLIQLLDDIGKGHSEDQD